MVNLLIRPEGLKLERASAAAEPPHAIVTAVQLLGATSLIQFQFDSASGYDGSLQARMAGASRLKSGHSVRVTLDRDMAFVFPSSRNASRRLIPVIYRYHLPNLRPRSELITPLQRILILKNSE